MPIYKHNGPRWALEDQVYVPSFCAWATVESYNAETARYTVRIGTAEIRGPGDVRVKSGDQGIDWLDPDIL